MRVAAHSARTPRLRSALREEHVPAPVLGIDVVHPASALDPRQALIAINVVSGDRGLGARPGTQEHATNVGSPVGEVRSILPFHGASDKLFACAQDGIYDVTAGGAAPSRVFAFGTPDSNAGYGESVAFVNFANNRYLLLADESNGYLLYDAGAGTWGLGSVTGVAATSLVSVTQWGARVWFTERGSTRAWYLALGAIGGAATSFDFGPFFSHGGHLAGLWRWTRDGGAGMNDALVAVSTNGDVVVFEGTDPVLDFARRGSWHVGSVPAGRRLASPYGGDLLLLSGYGLLPLARLVVGQAVAPDTYETTPIRPLFLSAMATQGTRKGWHVIGHPAGGFLMVNTPGIAGEPQEQFAMSYATRGWSRLRGLDVLSSELWEGQLYFGTRDGRVLKSAGRVDNVKLGGDTSQAKAIECASLGGFSNYENLRRKQVKAFWPVFLTQGVDPAHEAYVRYDYKTDIPSAALGAAVGGSGAWDVGLWDVAKWGGGPGKTRRRRGVRGIGTAFAVGAHWYSQDDVVLVGYDVAWEEGRLL